MAFDPTQPFEVVEDPQAQAGGAPRFDPSQAFEVVDDGQTGLIEGVGNSIKRGWTMSQMASEMEKPAPDPQRVAALQQEMQAVPPSDEYMTVMDDRRAPEESWTAFKSAPVKVLAELMGESFSAFAGQMIEKAPNRVAIGLGTGAGMGASVAGIGAVPGGFIGAGAGFAEASGAASYSLEMAGGVLEAMEQAGVPLDNPEALGQALQDPQRMQLAREFAQRKAVPIAIFDGASAVIGGRMFGGGKVTSAMQRLGQGMAETFTQAAMGASGEASGQLAQSGGITSGRAILAEGVAEIPTGLLEIGAGQLSQSGATANQPAATAPAATAPQPAPFTPPPAAETVVVEETFGEPTTAAAEPAAAAAPAFDPSQGFEVVQEPSETIVTEPPAAPRFQFDLADDTATAPEMDAEADVFAGVPQQQAPVVAQEPEVAAPAEAPIDVAPEPVAQSQPVTGQAAPSSFTQAFRAAKNTEDKRLAVFKAVADGTVVPSVIEAAESGKPLPSLEKFKSAFPFEETTLPDRVDISKVVIKPIKPAEAQQAAKSHASDDPNRFVLNGVFHDADAQMVVATDGRRLVAIPKKIDGNSRIARLDTKGPLGDKDIDGSFPNWRQVVPTVDSSTTLFNVDIDKARRAGTVLSGINKSLKGVVKPAKVKVGMATLDPVYVKDSVEALLASGAKKIYAASKDDASPVMMRGDNGAMAVIMPMRGAQNDLVVDASTVIGEVIGNEGRQVRQMFEAGNPNAPAKKSRTRIKKMTAQSGAIDLSIVEDLVEYGKTVYRAGMSFGKWAGQMVKEFGQGIASFLKQAFDRIVQAYKDSPYSDTTGAVGDVRPKAKPRQFEQRVSQAENVSQETKDLIGNDMYEVLRLEPLSQEAAARLAEIGVDAAERSILLLADPKAVATPLDFAIAQHLQINLDATGFPARAAAITRIISQKATSFGQTISTLKMFARLSPEGVVQYANQVIEEHINSLPPERQQQIRASQETMAQAEKDLATTRKRTAEEAIINGTQGGEKIQDKLKRRIPDKTQKQRTNVSIRSVLTSQTTKAEATKQITQVLTDNGISQSEATALATAITSRFYTVLENARKAMASNLKPKSGKGRMTAEKLTSQLKDGAMSDQDFIAALSQMVGLPAMTPATRAELLKLANEYKAATDDDIRLVTAGKIFERIHELVPPDFWTKVRTFRIIMMLFSPKTWARNIGGNVVQWTLNAGADSIVNGFVDPALTAGKAAYLRARGKTPEQIASAAKRTSAFAKTRRVRALLTPISDLKKGYLWNQQNNPTANWWDNSKAALDHLRVLSKLTTQNKFDMADIKDVGRRVFSNPFMAFLEGTTSIALGGPDRGFWMSAYRASLAQREAVAKRNGEWTGLPSPEDIEGAQADAMAAIYQQKNSISDLGIGVRTELNKFSTRWAAKVIPGVTETTQYGLGSMLVTFAQVPGALARTAINWSPLGTINALYSSMNGILWKTSKQRIGKPFNQAEFNKAFTQAIGGTGIYVAGYWLYAMGIITASREEDKDLEAMRKAMGMGQYSINLSALKRMLLSGNIWERQPTFQDDAIYRYDWLQPVAITFAAGAELAKMVEENDRAGIKKGLAAKAGMAAISLAAGAKSLEDLPLLSGLSSFMRTWGNEGMLAAVTKTVASEPSAFIPQLVRQANQLNNNLIRETRGGDSGVLRAFNQLAANTPGVSDSYPVRFDITGTPIERYQRNSNTIFNVLAIPATRIRRLRRSNA
jgi:hypothetical protein